MNRDVTDRDGGFANSTQACPSSVTVERIMKTVCDYYGISAEDVRVKKKNREYTMAYGMITYLCRMLMSLTYKEIAEQTKVSDYITVISGEKTFIELVDKDKQIRSDLEDIVGIIKGSNEKII